MTQRNFRVRNGLTIDGTTSGSSSFASTATGTDLTYVLPGAQGSASTVLTNDGSGALSWTTAPVSSVSGSGAGIDVTPTTGAVVVSNTGVTSIVAGTNISISSATGAVTINSTGSGGVSSITGTANQIIASSSTGAVTLSTPQDIATTSNPTFAGATLGNITVGLANDQVINSITGDLNIQAQGGTQSVIVSGQFTSNNDLDTLLQTSSFTKLSASTNSIVPTLFLNASSTGTVAPGFGTELICPFK